jgi:hypothetical protein
LLQNTGAGSVPEVSFRVQWLDTLISQAFNENEYLELLKDTDCMLLSYCNSSYRSRLSRIAIEAASMGVPMVYTKGGWLEEIVTEHCAGWYQRWVCGRVG